MRVRRLWRLTTLSTLFQLYRGVQFYWWRKPPTCRFNIELFFIDCKEYINHRGRRGRVRMVVGFTATFAISAYHHLRYEFESCSGEVYSVQHYVIKYFHDCNM
jgi:hypothetical protein